MEPLGSGDEEFRTSRPPAACPHNLPPQPARLTAAPRAQCPEPLLSPRDPALGPNKLCIVLDLDGTLLRSFTRAQAPPLPEGLRVHTLETANLVVVERPGLHAFLRGASRLGELVVFTAASRSYARAALRHIGCESHFGGRIVSRESTTATAACSWAKDLARLGRNLGRTVIVDDTPAAYSLQPENGIAVKRFDGADERDCELQFSVLPVLERLAGDEARDVRELAAHDWGRDPPLEGPRAKRGRKARAATPPPPRGERWGALEPRAVMSASVTAAHTPTRPEEGGRCHSDRAILALLEVAERFLFLEQHAAQEDGEGGLDGDDGPAGRESLGWHSRGSLPQLCAAELHERPSASCAGAAEGQTVGACPV